MKTVGDTTSQIAVLGASGYIGSHLCSALVKAGVAGIAVVRRPILSALPVRVVVNFRDSKSLGEAIRDCRTIVHLADEAGRFTSCKGPPPIASTLADILGQRDDAEDVRLIFASSIYARLDEEGHPNDYGALKREQESLLLTLPKAIGLRLPPVYGPGCGGSFRILSRAVARGLPLPLGRAFSERSYLSVNNLCDLLITLATASEDAWTETTARLFEPEDARRISTRDLALAFARDRGNKAKLLPIPRPLLAAVAGAVGKTELVRGAFDPLEARGNADLMRFFGWKPDGGLPETLPTRN